MERTLAREETATRLRDACIIFAYQFDVTVSFRGLFAAKNVHRPQTIPYYDDVKAVREETRIPKETGYVGRTAAARVRTDGTVPGVPGRYTINTRGERKSLRVECDVRILWKDPNEYFENVQT